MSKRGFRGSRGMAAALAALLAVGMAGCVPKRGTLAEQAAASAAAEKGPNMAIHGGITLDFDEAQDSCEEILADEEYTLSSYIDSFVDEDTKTVNLIWPLRAEATEEDGVRYANAIIRAFNDACAEQDFSIAASTEDSWGGLYEKYAVNVQVFREGDILTPQNYLVSMTVPAGQQVELVPFSQYDGVNEVILSDGPSLIPGGKYSGDLEALEKQNEENAAARESLAAEKRAAAEAAAAESEAQTK